MTLLQRVWNWLTSSSRASRKKQHPDLNPIDSEVLAKDLDLATKGRLLGEKNLPSGEMPSAPEALVVERLERARSDYVEWATFRRTVLDKDIAKLEVRPILARARKADEEFEAKASTLLGDNQGLLQPLARANLLTLQELRTFRDDNRLERDARVPSRARFFLQVSALVLMVVIEGLLNATFFAQGIESGLIGGFGFAALFALVNVVVSFALGYLLVRYTFHTNVGLKLAGWLGVTLAVILMTVMALLIAHFRDSLGAEVQNAQQYALQTLVARPFHLADIFSWILFALTLLFGLLALVDGIFIDDPYPGYGAVYRRSQEAREDYEIELEELREELGTLKEHVLKDLDNTIHQSKISLASLGDLLQSKEEAADKLNILMQSAQHALNYLLKEFRDANMATRSAPAPSYFGTIPELKGLPLPNFDTATDRVRYRELSTQLDALVTEAQGLRNRILASFSRRYDTLQPLEEHFGREQTA